MKNSAIKTGSMSYFKECTNMEEAKVTYRKLALSMHPDKGGSNEKFQELGKQYERFKIRKGFGGSDLHSLDDLIDTLFDEFESADLDPEQSERMRKLVKYLAVPMFKHFTRGF